jgi:hypothetical protein
MIIILLRPKFCNSIASNKIFLHISMRNIRSSRTQTEVSRTDAFVLAMRIHSKGSRQTWCSRMTRVVSLTFPHFDMTSDHKASLCVQRKRIYIVA